MTSEIASRRNWTSSSPEASHSHIRNPLKKSAFTRERFEISDDNESPQNTKMRKSKSHKQGFSDYEKEHTVIDIENNMSSPSTKKVSRILKSRSVSKKQSNSLESDSSGDEKIRARTADIQNDNYISSGGSQLAIKSKTTTSALLLADDNALMGSPIIRDGTIWNCVEFGEPRKRTEAEWNSWNKLIYCPSRYSGPEIKKSSDDIESRIPNDEGLFVSEPLPLSKNNWNLLRWRLFSENANHWFDANGKLFCFPDPYRPEPIQPFRDEETTPDEDDSIVFVPIKLDALEDFRGYANKKYELEIDLGYVNFSHHPYFSKEHVIATKLLEAYEDYSQRRLNKVTERSINKLKALREAVGHTKKTLNTMLKELENTNEETEDRNSLKEAIAHNRKRLMGYRNDIRRCSLARDQGYWDDKASIATVLDSWKQLKNIREEQGYTNTSFKLNIIELPSDPREETEILLQEISEDLKDLEEESVEMFELEMAKFHAKMKRWTNRKRRSRKDSGDVTDESERSLSKRPKPPIKQDIEEFKNMVERRYKEIRRRPGEPNIILDLVRTALITQANQMPEGAVKEKQRRRALKKCRVELHLLLNGMEIYISKPREINSDFSVFLGFSVPISLRERPDILEIEILELGTNIKTFRINVPLPNKDVTVQRSQMQKIKFFSEDVIKPSHEGVGCGLAFEILGREYEAAYTKGHLTIRSGWSIDLDGNIKCPKTFDGYNDTSEDPTIRKLSNNSQLDPNDPRNATIQKTSIMGTLKQTDRSLIPSKFSKEDDSDESGFQLDKYMDEFQFCKMENIEKSSRFRMLQLRDQGVPEFKNIKMISPFDRDISGDAFLAYERRLKEVARKGALKTARLSRFGKKQLKEDDIVYESNRLEKIREIRLGVLQLFEKSLKQITFEDFVLEEQIPDIGTLGLNLMSFFQPRRPLRPMRKERKRIQASNLVDTKIDLIFNIVRAFNLPVRKDTDIGLLTTESVTGIQLAKKRTVGNYSTIRPFVEVWFQRKVARTTTAVGSNPTWNQELQLNLTVPNDDYSQANLSKMDDMAFLLVYDEVAVDMLDDERRRDTDIYQRIEKRWLGSIGIPFSTLYTNGRIEGTFKLNMPPILLGYEAQGMGTHFGGLNFASRGSALSAHPSTSDTKISTGSPFNNQKNAFITIFITLQPAVQPTLSPKEDSASGESADMMAYVKSWKNAFERRFPERFVKPFVMTADGDTILCTRYLKAIQPPEIFLNTDNEVMHVMEDLAHYVSLFPFVRDSTLGITDYSLWFTADVFILTPGGGVDDHAVLLACFFMHLNVPCWIVHGNSIPDGPSTFVVTSFKGMDETKGIPKGFKNVVLIWNPCTGECFNANDNFCPLQRIWSATGKNNMWANISDGERPHQIDWDIGKSKSWQPMFTKSVAEDKIPCVQNAILKYKTSDQVQAKSLAQRIERHLKDAFMKWRTTSKTNWNRYCSATLRRLLPKLEEMKSGRSRGQDAPGSGSIESAMSVQSGSVVSVNDEHLMELREVMTSYQMSGFPLQQPYVNMETIMETVFATGVHTIDTPDVEFGLAAYAHAYPASVYSVWIYVAALHRRK